MFTYVCLGSNSLAQSAQFFDTVLGGFFPLFLNQRELPLAQAAPMRILRHTTA